MTRLLQEQVAFAEGDGAMDVTSLRLPYIFGQIPGRMPLWKMFSDQIKQTEVFPVHPEGRTAAVTTKQVAQAAVGAAEQGKQHGINMELASEVRAMDLSIDPAPTKETLGYEDVDVLAEIDKTIDYIIEHE